MKQILLFVLITISVFSWEVTTHRAIDRKAIAESKTSGNFGNFIADSGIDQDYKFINENYDGYGMSYFDYIAKGEKGGMSDWHQTFTGDDPIRDIIEAGTMLEDAVWPGAWRGNGRFLNHFYEAQNGGKALNVGGFVFQNAVTWARWGVGNDYSYRNAMEYFFKGFTKETKAERRKYQAKMLVSVGHLMHLLNDMNVPAHVRDDSHPSGNPLEIWMRGGEKERIL